MKCSALVSNKLTIVRKQRKVSIMSTAAEVIRLLDLQPLAMEGGYFRETYRSKTVLTPACLGSAFPQHKAAGTGIYYLLTPDTYSALHRLPTDEVFHHYSGGPVEMLQLWPDGRSEVVLLGSDLKAGQRPQVVVPAGVWQGSRLLPGGEFALMGTTMAPGFDYADYESGDRKELTKAYPGEADRIAALTAG
jgi:predicted cupin superfamily sugar epimerase